MFASKGLIWLAENGFNSFFFFLFFLQILIFAKISYCLLKNTLAKVKD